MFQIRVEHLQALTRIQENQFIQKLVQHAHSTCPEEAARFFDEDLELVAKKAVAKGRRCGIEEENHICRLLQWMLKHDLDFDRKFEWAQAILTAPDTPFASNRMLQLANAMAALNAASS